jgi:serine/threonine-protein kinase
MQQVSVRPVVDDYELLDVLGGGGMATVWRARRRGSAGREVALKVLHAHLQRDERAVERFLREARIGARVRHAHVVPVLEVVRSKDTLALAVELVDGGSIASLSRVTRPPPRVVFRLLDDLLGGLSALHALEDDGVPLNVVHRDVSPENVLVGRDGVARLSDFGIARGTRDTKLTATGSLHGKLPYVAPEQARGDAVDARADVWAAGVVAYELVTGRAFLSDSLDVTAALRRLIEGRYPRLESSAPAAIAEAIDRALELDATDRWPDAETFRRRLQAAAELEDEGLADAVEVAAWVEAARGGMPTSEAPADVESPTSRALPSRPRRAVLVVASTVVLGLATLAVVLATAEPRPAASVPSTPLVPPVAPAPRPLLAPVAPAPAAATNEVGTVYADPPPTPPNPVRRAASRRRAVTVRSASPPPTPTTTEVPRSPLASNPYERR